MQARASKLRHVSVLSRGKAKIFRSEFNFYHFYHAFSQLKLKNQEYFFLLPDGCPKDNRHLIAKAQHSGIPARFCKNSEKESPAASYTCMEGLKKNGQSIVALEEYSSSRIYRTHIEQIIVYNKKQ